MSFYVRKISRAKWNNENNDFSLEKLRADAITKDLRTENDTLSLWLVNSESDIERAIVALVSNCDRIDTMDFVLIPSESIDNKIQIVNTLGQTPAEKFNHLHRDASQLNYHTFSIVASSILEEIKKDKNVRRMTKATIKSLFKRYVDSGDINVNILSDSLKKEFV